MTMTFQAVYEGGVLRPSQPLSLAEGSKVDVTVASDAPESPSMSEDEIVRRIQQCKSYRKWLEVTKMLPTDDEGYDIVKALDENRRLCGERPLLPGDGEHS